MKVVLGGVAVSLGGDRLVPVNKKSSTTDINFKGIKSFALVKKIKPGLYKIMSHKNRANTNMIISKLKAFNDMEIAYSDDLDGNELIDKTKSSLWTLSDDGNGALLLQRSF